METEPTEIKAGTLLTIASGEYSDYGVFGVFRALREFNPASVLEEFLVLNPRQREEYGGEPAAFVAFLVQSGLVETLESRELHLGNYGRLETTICEED